MSEPNTKNWIDVGEEIPRANWVVVALNRGNWGKGRNLAEAVKNCGGTLSRHYWGIFACSDPDCYVDGMGSIVHAAGHMLINITSSYGAHISSCDHVCRKD